MSLIWLLFLPLLSTAMIEDLNFDLGKDDVFEILWKFQFSSRGELSLSGSTDIHNLRPNTSTQLMVCSESSLVQLRTMKIEDICASKPFNATACEWVQLQPAEQNLID